MPPGAADLVPADSLGRLGAGLADLGVRPSGDDLARLDAFVEMLMRWNAAHGLTARASRQELVTRHILDSAAALPFLPAGLMLDAGSGGGLPGVVLALLRPETSWVLLDSSARKTAFLGHASMELGLSNVQVVRSRLENYEPQDAPVAMIARALAPLPKLVALARRLLDRGANRKGGVGKTTTAINLTACLAQMGRKALLVDLDPQANATTGCGVDRDAVGLSTYDLLMGKAPAADIRVRIDSAGFDLLPATAALTAAEVELLQLDSGRELRLRDALAEVLFRYQAILFDCPPSLNILTLNALVAAEGVLVPIQCEYFSLEGLSSLVGVIEDLCAHSNPDLEISGIIRTMYDGRNRLARDVSAQLQKHFPDELFRTIIPRNVRLAEAPGFGVPAIQHDRLASGALAYAALAGELVRRGLSE